MMHRTPTYAARLVDTSRGDRASGALEGDGYLEKLIKYVPGEVIAVYAAIMAASAGVSEDAGFAASVTRGVFFFFLFATPAYFWLLSARLPASDRPVWYFYALSVAAFAIWALAVSDQVRVTFGASAGLAEFILAAGAFAVPFLDELLTAILAPKRAPD